MSKRLGKVSLLFMALVLALAGVGAAYAAWTDSITISGTVDTGQLCVELADWSSLDSAQGPGWPPDYYLGEPDRHSNPGFAHESGAPVSWLDPDGKNVGWTVLTAEDTGGCTAGADVLHVDLHNVYPSYFNSISIYPYNSGTIPWKIWAVKVTYGEAVEVIEYQNFYLSMDLSGNGVDDFEIKWGDNFGNQQEPGGGDYPEISFWMHVLQDEGEGVQLESFSFTIELIAIQWNEYVSGPLME